MSGESLNFAPNLFFASEKNIKLNLNHKVYVGINDHEKKPHAFDLGCDRQKILVECKSHRWTTGNNVPSAKMTVWNEAMYYFHVVPHDYRKIMFVLNHCNDKGESLVSYYLGKFRHLIPNKVEFWEYNEIEQTATQINIW